MIRGQVMLRPLGVEGIPIFNVENACASASSALNLGWQSVATGMHDVVLCLGAEKLSHDDKTVGLNAIGTAIDVEMRAELTEEVSANGDDEGARSFFMDHNTRTWRAAHERLGCRRRGLRRGRGQEPAQRSAQPARPVRSGAQHRAGAREPKRVVDPLTVLMCSPISDGAAAVVLLSEQAAGAGA